MIPSGRCDVVLDKLQQSREKETEGRTCFSTLEFTTHRLVLFKSGEWASKRNKRKNSKS